MSGVQLVAAGTVAAVGATLQGSIGFGLNVVAAPLLVLIDTSFVPGPALAAALMLAPLVGFRDRAGLDRRGVGWILAGRVPGTVLGASAVAVLSGRGVAVAMSVMVLFDVVLSASGWRLPRTIPTMTIIGAVSGLMGTVSSIGGPPVAMLYQDSRGAELRSTLSMIFTVGAFMSVVFLAAAGEFGMEQIRLALTLAPGLAIGFLASRWTARWLDRGFVRPVILGVSACSAAAALVRYAV